MHAAMPERAGFWGRFALTPEIRCKISRLIFYSGTADAHGRPPPAPA